jgi:hypothetical protein
MPPGNRAVRRHGSRGRPRGRPVTAPSARSAAHPGQRGSRPSEHPSSPAATTSVPGTTPGRADSPARARGARHRPAGGASGCARSARAGAGGEDSDGNSSGGERAARGGPGTEEPPEARPYDRLDAPLQRGSARPARAHPRAVVRTSTPDRRLDGAPGTGGPPATTDGGCRKELDAGRLRRPAHRTRLDGAARDPLRHRAVRPTRRRRHDPGALPLSAACLLDHGQRVGSSRRQGRCPLDDAPPGMARDCSPDASERPSVSPSHWRQWA